MLYTGGLSPLLGYTSTPTSRLMSRLHTSHRAQREVTRHRAQSRGIPWVRDIPDIPDLKGVTDAGNSAQELSALSVREWTTIG